MLTHPFNYAREGAKLLPADIREVRTDPEASAIRYPVEARVW